MSKFLTDSKLLLGFRVIASIFTVFAIILLLAGVLYIKVLPSLVSNTKVIEYVQKTVKKELGAELVVKNPMMKTGFTPVVRFRFDNLSIKKGQDELLTIDNFNTAFSWAKVLQHKVVLENLSLDYIFADVSKLMALAPTQEKEKEQKQSDWSVDWLDSLFFVKKCLFLYDIDQQTHVKVDGHGISIADAQNPKYVRFKVAADIKKGNESVKIALDDNDTVFIRDHKLFIENGILKVNDSKISIDATADKKQNFDLTVFSKNFQLENVVGLLATNLVIPNGKEMLAFFKDINGNFDFNVNMTNQGLNGNVKLNKGFVKLTPLADLPLTLSDGFVDINSKEIILRDFKGFYGNAQKNKLTMSGTIKDYTKSVDTDIEIKGKATNELAKNYISKVIGYPITLTGDSGMRLFVKSIYNKIDVLWQFKIAKGNDLLIDGASISPVNYDRALTADLHVENNVLNIKSINYYIASVLDKNSKGIKPILTLNGDLDIAKNGEIKTLGFNIPKPLPSEFLNVLIGQKIFKKGTIAGNMYFVNTGAVPSLNGELKIEGVRIPSQRLGIKEGSMRAKNDSILLAAKGRFKKTNYTFDGKLKNSLVFPIVVKDVNLSVDDLDVERLMTSMNNQNTTAATTIDVNRTEETAKKLEQSENDTDDAYTFDTGILIIEKCVLNLAKGFYKEIKFGNLIANLTLNDKGVLEVTSNKFDFAEGISTLKVLCDLKKHDYMIRLGVKDIDSDLIATNLLELKKEISGKARGLIYLHTDDSLKLNGEIKFDIVNGTIGKIGLVEYVLKFASLFRNPLAMISPSAIVDLVNIPDGDFDNIYGELKLKDNVVEKIMIKSMAPQLSSFIVGRFDLDTRDATLRIYTKFSNKNKGLAGLFRNISLNSLANRIPLSSRNDSNYYEAELKMLPPIEADERDCQVFLTKVDGEVETGNFISSLKKIK